MHPSTIQTIKLQRILVTNLLVLIVVAMAFKAVSSGSAIMMGGVIALPIAIYFVNRPVHLLIASFLVGAAGLTLPGIPGGLSLVSLLHAFVVAMGIGFLAVDKDRNRRKERSERYLIGFLVVILVTMAVRGTGIRMLGSDMWGGRTYITAILAMMFYVFSPWLRLGPGHVKFLVFGQLIAGLLPVFVQAAFLLSGGTFYILAFFIDAQLRGVAGAAFGVEDSISRFSTLRNVGASLLPLAFVFPLKGWKAVAVRITIIPLALLFTALSGFRSLVIGMIITCALWGFISVPKKKRLLYVATLGVVGMVGWLTLVAGVARLFPLNVQRAVSWVPFSNVSEIAQENASNSTSWRLEIWRQAWEEVPQYLLVGKGVSFPGEYLADMSRHERVVNDTVVAFRTHNYHSGPLQLLLDLGLPGLLLCSAFFFTTCREHAAGLKRFTKPRIDHLYYKYLTVVYIWQVLSFYLLYGDLTGVFVRILVLSAMLRILRYSLDEQLAEEETQNHQNQDRDHAEPAVTSPPQIRAMMGLGT